MDTLRTEITILSNAFIAGGVCAVISAFLNPLDVTKIRLQNQKVTSSGVVYRGMVSGALRIFEEEGLAGWVKGLNASMMRELTLVVTISFSLENFCVTLSSSHR